MISKVIDFWSPILVLYFLVAKSILAGVQAAGAEGHLIQIPETLSAEVLAKMHAPEKDKTIPTITLGAPGENTIGLEDAFVNCDGILMGIPTRFGGMPAQVKALWDATGGLWMSGALFGKPIGVFFSTSTLGGGYENQFFLVWNKFISFIPFLCL